MMMIMIMMVMMQRVEHKSTPVRRPCFTMQKNGYKLIAFAQCEAGTIVDRLYAACSKKSISTYHSLVVAGCRKGSSRKGSVRGDSIRIFGD